MPISINECGKKNRQKRIFNMQLSTNKRCQTVKNPRAQVLFVKGHEIYCSSKATKSSCLFKGDSLKITSSLRFSLKPAQCGTVNVQTAFQVIHHGRRRQTVKNQIFVGDQRFFGNFCPACREKV